MFLFPLPPRETTSRHVNVHNSSHLDTASQGASTALLRGGQDSTRLAALTNTLILLQGPHMGGADRHPSYRVRARALGRTSCWRLGAAVWIQACVEDRHVLALWTYSLYQSSPLKHLVAGHLTTSSWGQGGDIGPD